MLVKKITLLILLTILISGCVSMHFDNGSIANNSSVSDNKETIEKLHHNFFADAWEVSDPVNLSKHCNNSEWESVKTEISFLNALSRFPQEILKLPIWYPKSVTILCK